MDLSLKATCLRDSVETYREHVSVTFSFNSL